MYIKQTWTDGNPATPVSAARLGVIEQGIFDAQAALVQPTAKSADYTATVGDLVLMTGAHTVTLPTAPAAGSQVQISALTATVIVNRGGTDTITTQGASSLTTLSVLIGASVTLRFLAGVWYNVGNPSPANPIAQSADYAATAGQTVLMTGAHTVTLPSAPVAGTSVSVLALTGVVTISKGGADTINVRGSTGNASCSIGAGGNLTLQYLSTVWYVVDGSQTLTPSPWSAPTLTNSWVNLAGGTNLPAGYMKDPQGYVHLRGSISSGASGSVALTLPAGYRLGPSSQSDIFPIGVWNGSTAIAGFAAVQATGAVVLYYASAMSYLSLIGIAFLAEL